MVNSKEEVNILELYGKECLLTKEDFIKQYKINKNGLTNQEAESNLLVNLDQKDGIITFWKVYLHHLILFC